MPNREINVSGLHRSQFTGEFDGLRYLGSSNLCGPGRFHLGLTIYYMVALSINRVLPMNTASAVRVRRETAATGSRWPDQKTRHNPALHPAVP